MINSRPIRFLAFTVGGWIAFRTVMLWPAAQVLPDIVRALAPIASAQPVVPTIARPLALSASPPIHAAAFLRPVIATTEGPIPVVAVERVNRAVASTSVAFALAAPPSPGLTPVAATGSEAPPVFTESRLSGSAWAILRPGGRATPFASQLGGSQAGVRLAYAIDPARRLAATARFSSALESRQREASIGLDWRPTRLPVHLVVEERISLDGGRSGPAIGAIGGVGPAPIGAGFRLEAYGQAGVIARDGGEGFADGSIRIARPVLGVGRAALDLGAGAWGGAQRGAARLDIGPSLGASIPVGRRSLRIAIDWRQRVAGQARPGSGPALSLGTDF